MKRILWWIVLNFGFAAAVWFGFVDGVEGAQYAAKFFVWAVTLPMGVIGLTDAMHKKLAAEPERHVTRRISHLIAWFALGVFIWHGHIATAAAWGFWMIAVAVATEGAKRHRAGLSAAPAV